jgi:hypothetical protein
MIVGSLERHLAQTARDHDAGRSGGVPSAPGIASSRTRRAQAGPPGSSRAAGLEPGRGVQAVGEGEDEGDWDGEGDVEGEGDVDGEVEGEGLGDFDGLGEGEGEGEGGGWDWGGT